MAEGADGLGRSIAQGAVGGGQEGGHGADRGTGRGEAWLDDRSPTLDTARLFAGNEAAESRSSTSMTP